MAAILDFIDVGQGNMTILQLDYEKVLLYDCNITDDNETDVLQYAADQIGEGSEIEVFVRIT